MYLRTALFASALIGSSGPDGAQQFSRALGAALQADAGEALAALEGADLSTLPSRDQASARCMRDRFGAKSRPDRVISGSVADRALGIYRDYWHAALMNPQGRSAGEELLARRLQQLLGGPSGANLETLEPMLSAFLKMEGVHSLQGRTGLLRELMIWTVQQEKLMHVSLPEGEHDVRVFLLDGFGSFGWSHYATCGRASTGGWATEHALFAVVPRYPALDHEEFRVTFLGHEAQHFADKQRFKQLEPWEFEYRAKLTELAQVDATRAKVIGKFLDDQGDDPASPHSYANRRVLEAMVRRLGLEAARDLASVELQRMQAAAVDLLREDSARLVAARRAI